MNEIEITSPAGGAKIPPAKFISTRLSHGNTRNAGARRALLATRSRFFRHLCDALHIAAEGPAIESGYAGTVAYRAVDRETAMRMSDFAVLALGALIVAGILAISPDVTATASGVASAPYSIGLSGLGRNGTYAPEEDLPAY